MNPASRNAALRFEIRPMAVADVDRVMEIAASLASAPQWSRRAYLDALYPLSTPQRIALVTDHRQYEDLSIDQPAPDSLPLGIQGFAVASLLAPQAELEVIAVANQVQRQGIGYVL